MFSKQSIKQFLKPNWKKLLIFGIICLISIYCMNGTPWHETEYSKLHNTDMRVYRVPSPVLTFSLMFVTPAPITWRAINKDTIFGNTKNILYFLTLSIIWYYFFTCLVFFYISKFSNIPKTKLILGIWFGVFATLISCLFVFLMYYILPFRAYEIASILVTIPYIVTAGRIFVMCKRETERELVPSFIITTIFLYNFFLYTMYSLAFF